MSKTVAIMQPYLLPYIGYFQLINQVDEFIILDNVQYIRRGWINKNKILINNQEVTFTFPVNKSPQDTLIFDCSYKSLDEAQEKLIKTIQINYSKSPNAQTLINLLNKGFKSNTSNVSEFNSIMLKNICDYLGINTPLINCSDIIPSTTNKGQLYIIEICKKRSADLYINLPGGKNLYNQETFDKNDLKLKFIEADKNIEKLSIIHLIANFSKNDIQMMLDKFSIT